MPSEVPLGNLKDRHVFCCPFSRTLTLVIATRLLKSLNCKLLQKHSISKNCKKKINNNINISANYGRIQHRQILFVTKQGLPKRTKNSYAQKLKNGGL